VSEGELAKEKGPVVERELPVPGLGHPSLKLITWYFTTVSILEYTYIVHISLHTSCTNLNLNLARLFVAAPCRVLTALAESYKMKIPRE
jgi:hypothetical protein